jgi:hypothetical protein
MLPWIGPLQNVFCNGFYVTKCFLYDKSRNRDAAWMRNYTSKSENRANPQETC